MRTKIDTKQKGDIAEQAAIISALKKGWNVLQPIGDRLPYDLVFDINNRFVRVQVKSAWFEEKSRNWIVDNRKCKTNRRKMRHEGYTSSDFEFGIAYLEEIDVFYVFPVEVFIGYAGSIHMIEEEGRQRKARSSEFREAWNLIVAE